jgi:hypothetical protein
MPAIEREIRSGEPIQVGDYEIIPQSQHIRIVLPSQRGGLIWNRPRAVIVRTADGNERILPVRDLTRIMIWSMLAGGLVGAILIGLMHRSR